MAKRKEQAEDADPDESEEESCSSSEESAEDEASEQDIVDVDFEFFDPKPEDFHGAKALLRTYLDETEWDLTGFVDLFLNQTRVGTVVKTGEDESPIGLITALNIKRHKELPSMQGVRKFLYKHGKKCAQFSKLEALWESEDNIGLLVSERVLNLPLELCAPLYDGLFDEISWATEDEPSDELRDSYRFKQYLILSRVYQEVIPPSSSKTKKKKKREDTDGSLIFIKPEDEFFLQLSSWHFTFPVQAESMVTHQSKGMRLLRLVMAVNAQQISTFKSKLQDMQNAGDC